MGQRKATTIIIKGAVAKAKLDDSLASKYKSFPIGDISDVESQFQRSVTALGDTLMPSLKFLNPAYLLDPSNNKNDKLAIERKKTMVKQVRQPKFIRQRRSSQKLLGNRKILEPTTPSPEAKIEEKEDQPLR